MTVGPQSGQFNAIAAAPAGSTSYKISRIVRISGYMSD
jgi:hypothetical protein